MEFSLVSIDLRPVPKKNVSFERIDNAAHRALDFFRGEWMTFLETRARKSSTLATFIRLSSFLVYATPLTRVRDT